MLCCATASAADNPKQEGLAAASAPTRLRKPAEIEAAVAGGRPLFRLGIKGSFFFRLHAPRYNVFDFENYRILKVVRGAGHEIGLHSEIVDQSMIWQEDAAECLRRDLDVISRMIGGPIHGIASHGDMTGHNNLDFWKERSPAEFGLEYEAYDDGPNFGLFKRSCYVSDSKWVRWKAYDNGVLRQRRPAAALGARGRRVACILSTTAFRYVLRPAYP